MEIGGWEFLFPFFSRFLFPILPPPPHDYLRISLKLLEITVGIKRVQILSEGVVDKLVLILKENIPLVKLFYITEFLL